MQRQEETTTGSGASKRKTFEFFNNMQFLDPFVKKRRYSKNCEKIRIIKIRFLYIFLRTLYTAKKHFFDIFFLLEQ